MIWKKANTIETKLTICFHAFFRANNRPLVTSNTYSTHPHGPVSSEDEGIQEAEKRKSRAQIEEIIS